MASTGTATIDFGGFPGSNEASVAVVGQDNIQGTSNAEAYFMAEASTDHTSNDHKYANALVALTCSTPTTGVGFTIYATSIHKMQGKFKVRWVWAN